MGEGAILHSVVFHYNLRVTRRQKDDISFILPSDWIAEPRTHIIPFIFISVTFPVHGMTLEKQTKELH